MSQMLLLIFSVALLLGFVAERLVHALVLAILYLLSRSTNDRQSRAALSVLTSVGAYLLNYVSFLLSVSVSLGSTVLQYIVSFIIAVITCSLLFVVFQYSNEVMFALSSAYNGELAASLQVMFVWPLKYLNWLFKALVPLWNAGWWLWKKVPMQVLVQTITRDLGLVMNFFEALFAFCKACADSLVTWIFSFMCCDGAASVAAGACNPQCFEAGARMFNFMTPMAKLRLMVVWIVEWLRTWCSVAMGPVDLLTYPFMDINFAKFMHFGANALLFTLTQLPALTIARCSAFGGVIDCVPDFGPVIATITAALHHLGLCLDNWLDVLILILEATLSLTPPVCDSVPALLDSPALRAAVFGRNRTVMAGLSDHMFARTDGYSAQFFSLHRDWQTRLHTRAFPFPVDVGHGIAAITHIKDFEFDVAGSDRMQLLGCACFDRVGSGIQILCGVGMQNDEIDEWSRTIEVQFQLPSTALVIGSCYKIEIWVETLRWPQTRHSQSVNPVSARVPVTADAAVWVKPRCSTDSIDLVCVDSFKQAACFPYCMALHTRGAGTQTMVLHDAADWNDGVTMLQRDCALYNVQNLSELLSTYAPPLTVQRNGSTAVNVRVDVSSACFYNPGTYTFKQRTPQYGQHPSIDLETQPFLFSGDLALTAIAGQMDARGNRLYSIQVQRIWGSQLNEFAVIPLNQPIPASQPCLTPVDCANVDCVPSCKAAIPYAFDAHIVSATSDKYVFWIANPTLEPFYAMAYYCQNKNSTNILQISALSSYGGIRMWRIDPYQYCPIDPVTKRSTCMLQQSAATRLLSALNFSQGFNTDLCTQVFDVKAESLEYVNEYNLALTVLRTTLSNVNTRTLQPVDPDAAQYITYWVNPVTMEPREGAMWAPEAPSVASEDGMLCPSQRRMPNLGSLVTELVSALVYAVRMPFFTLLYLPVMVQTECAVLTHGHSILESCGRDLFSLDGMFSSWFRANAFFWQAFAIVIDGFGPGPLHTMVNGATMWGESQIVAIEPFMLKSLMAVGSVNTMQGVETLRTTVGQLPMAIYSAAKIAPNPLAVVQFLYTLVERMVLQFLDGKHTVGNIFWNVIADGIVDFEQIVLQRMRQGCAGIALMTGYYTPHGLMTLQWCNAYVDMMQASLTMTTVFFVDIPLMGCVCASGVGQNFNENLMSKCYANAPDTTKPLLVALLDSNAALCPVLLNLTRTHFTEALDNMFNNLEGGTRQLASVIDWYMMDDEAGQCNNYIDNPFVLTLIPQPVDYFRVCGKTERCRLSCLTEFQAFERAKSLFSYVSRETVTTRVQSLFFNSRDRDTFLPVSTPLAALEVYDCTVPCGHVEVGDRCFALVGELNTDLYIVHYCVPSQLSMNVRRAREPVAMGLVQNAIRIELMYLADNGGDFYAGFKVLAMTKNAVFMCQDGCAQIWTVEDFGSEAKEFHDMYVLGHDLVMSIVVKTSTYFDTQVATYCSSLSLLVPTYPVLCQTDLWPRITLTIPVCELDEFYTCTNVLFVPKSSSDDARLERCHRSNQFNLECDFFKTAKSFVYNAGLGLVQARSARMFSSSQQWEVLSINDQRSHWLQIAKFYFAGDLVTSSSQASLDVDYDMVVLRECTLDNCIGCKDLNTQRLCYGAMQCQLARCIGTMVHQKRPLCAIGMNLQAMISQQLALYEGAWLMISETLVSIITMGVTLEPPRTVRWPDQAFYGYVCASKDVAATGISIAVASVNGLIQAIVNDPNTNLRQQWTNDAMAQYTMTLAATTNFLYQMALAPLYTLVATQKTFICSANSIMAIIGPNVVTIGDPAIQNYSARGAGQCLSQYFDESTRNSDSVHALVIGVVQNLRLTSIQLGLEAMIHPIDAGLTWLQGCVSGLQDVVQTADREHCNLPNFAVQHSFKCACNDDAFAVVGTRASETWMDQAFWCSTVMAMLQADGSTKYVWNPYSLTQLKDFLRPRLDTYLQCVSTGGSCTMPTTAIFEEQQVSMISVYQRCLANYQNKLWDAGTWVLFNQSMRDMLPASVANSNVVRQRSGAEVSSCIGKSHEDGSSNSACLDLFLQTLNIDKLDYFEYTPLPESDTISSIDVDACQSFTGPAKLDYIPETVLFRNCLDHYSNDDNCKLPGILWSGRSQNKVPVASVHSTHISDPVAQQTAATNAYASIHAEVMQALEAMADWDAGNVNVAIFSAEGDLLHQFADCLVMGALGRTDLWPAPDSLNKPVWSRSVSNADTRAFELPCSGEQLKGRDGSSDNNSPFTCGSYPRRAAIKYFVRSRGSSSTEIDANKQLVTEAVRNLIGNLTAAWSNLNNFQCQCTDSGERGFQCCTLPAECDPSQTCPCADGSTPSFACCECSGGSLLPDALRIPFTTIPGSNLVSTLFDDFARYMQTDVWTSNAPWLLWDNGAMDQYTWDESTVSEANDYMLFDTTEPVKYYDELGYPFRTTIWEQCHGLLEQVYYTLPLTRGTDRPTRLSTPYDPDGVSKTINLTYKEEWIQNVVRDAYLKSPVFWQYNVRHRPSDSVLCRDVYATQPLNVVAAVRNASMYLHGSGSMTLGAYDADCYCAWTFNASTCQVPPSVCEQLVQLLGSEQAVALCNSGGFFSSSYTIERLMMQLTQVTGHWAWPCSQFNVSDMWGLVADPLWMSTDQYDTVDSEKVWDQVLRNGTSGLRVGSLAWISQNSPVDPTQRLHSLHNVPLTECEPLTFETRKSLAEHFVDELFPAAQGVRQNAPLNACLRHAIELARMYAFQMFELTVSVAEQEALVRSWRRKCEQKLAQVSFCTTFGVYNVYQSSVDYGCEFSILPIFQTLNAYSLTPTCLIVFRGKVYDPCLCGFCQTQNINLYILADCGTTGSTCPTSCEIMHVKTLVTANDNQLPVFPVSSDSPVPLPLRRSNALNKLPPYMVNSAKRGARWDTAEGSGNNASFYCDMQVDWWPEEWLHPVGYHVTFPCSDGAPRTYDAAWAYLREGDQVKLRHVPYNLRNQTKRQNEFGGTGPCRTHNYGMPMHTLNTIRVCTQADNQPYDPTVPNPPFAAPDWNQQYCSASPYDVPWGPRGPTSVGMLFDRLVDTLPSDDYDPAFRTCSSDADCCASCSCFIGQRAYGVCVVKETGKFECAQHKHCSGGLMCSGEGLCVRGMLQILNNFTDSVTTRTFSDACQGRDTSGSSKEEVVPDILHSSGMCSYRSWYEHRDMISKSQCTSAVCTKQGSDAWNPTASAPGSLFDLGIMKVLPHVCDRDYEHFHGFQSCTPSDLLLVDDLRTPQTVQRGSVTRTYSLNKTVRLVRHAIDNQGLGFLGVPERYDQMGYKSANIALEDPFSSSIKPCSTLLPCTSQAKSNMWFVNGVRESNRQVTVKGVVRSYDLNDLNRCGSMGFVYDDSRCMLDAAVVPLFYVYCKSRSTGICTTYANGKYLYRTTTQKLRDIATQLNSLVNDMTEKPTSFDTYLTAVDSVQNIWASMKDQTWCQDSRFTEARVLHSYTNSKKPMGLYWLFSYSAYEFPFAHWFKCGWLSKMQLSSSALECAAWDDKTFNMTNYTTPVYYGTFSGHTTETLPLMQWLAEITGVFRAARVQAARNAVHEYLTNYVRNLDITRVPFYCYSSASFRFDFLENSTTYQSMAASTQTSHGDWPSTNIGICKNFETCFNHTNDMDMILQDIVSVSKTTYLDTGSCTIGSKCYTGISPSIKALLQDSFPDQIPVTQPFLSMFYVSGSSATPTEFDTRPDGCSSRYDCASDPCVCATANVTKRELTAAQISDVDAEKRAFVAFSGDVFPQTLSNANARVSGDKYSGFDICAPEVPCSFAAQTPRDPCPTLTNEKAISIQSKYCGKNCKPEWITDADDVRCPYEINGDSQNTCLNHKIGGNKVILPSAYLDYFKQYVINPVTCFNLTCIEPFTNRNNDLVFNMTQFTGNFYVKLECFFYAWEKTTGIPGRLFVNVQMKDENGNWNDKMSLSKQHDMTGLNILKTRPLSASYTAWDCVLDTLSKEDFSKSFIQQITQQIVKETEDRFNSATTKSLQQCQKNDLSKSTILLPRDCSYTGPSKSVTQLDSTRECDDDDYTEAVLYLYEYECRNEAIQNQCDVLGQIVDDICPDTFSFDIGDATLYSICQFVKPATKPCKSFEQLFRECKDRKFDMLKRDSTFTCGRFQYSYESPPFCTGSRTTCAYDSAQQAVFVENGLPRAGFCHDCVGSACKYTKGDYTYEQVRNNIDLYSISAVPVTTSTYGDTYLSSNAFYFSMKLKSKYKCDQNMQCSSQHTRKVQVRKNMYTCVPCDTVPEPFCSGYHLCGFRNNKTFAQVHASIKAQIEQKVAEISNFGVLPEIPEFMTYLPENSFRYNPQPLEVNYNKMMEQVDGVCSSTLTMPDMSTCQNDALLRKVENHYKTEYKEQDGYVIPKYHTLIWYVDNGQLLHSNIVSYFQVSRNKFIETLVNKSVCEQATLDSLLCYKTMTAFQILNPSTTGDFEVQEGCDAVMIDNVRTIDSQCQASVCGKKDDGLDKYNTFEGTDYAALTKRTQCGLRHGRTSRYNSQRSSYAINLCSKTPQTPYTCPMKQGMIGGGDGVAVTDVYAKQQLPPTWLPSGLWRNPVLQQKAVEYGNITLDGEDIGGHFIRMQVDSSGLLRVVDMPLRKYATLSSALGANQSAWMKDYSLARDLKPYVLHTCTTWLCPVKRRNFWASTSHVVPDPVRTRILYNNTLHPSTRRRANVWLGKYETRNGFCLCPVGDACQPASGPCSVADTILSLYDFEFRSATVKQPQQPCRLQTDWPYTGGVMRDESYLDPKISTSCHVLDRIPPFRYKYTNSETFIPGSQSTLEEGGACHMGRPPTYTNDVEHCVLAEKRSDAFILACADRNVSLPRRYSETKPHTSKRACSECDPLPVYETEQGESIPSEVSYGQLWRWAPARLLARDLRFRLCGNATTCDAAAQWSLDTFWPDMFARIADLYKDPGFVEEDVWSSDWMLCTGKNAETCRGTATKTEWLQNRDATCKRILTLDNTKDAVENLTICNLDNRLDTLCRVIQAARYKVFEANCKITGACRTSSFFYQPALYDISNNQFVRETVAYFYNYSVAGSCPVYDVETMEVLTQNQANVQECAAQDLQVLQIALQLARSVVHLFVKIQYYWGKIAIEVMTLLVGGDISEILNNIVADFRIIVEEFKTFFKEIADLIYKMITESGELGKWLKNLVIEICKFLNIIFDTLIRPLLCIMRAVILAIFEIILGVIDLVNTVSFGSVDGLRSNIDTTKNRISDAWNCDIENPFDCAQLESENENMPSNLPSATRCWMGYSDVDAGAGCEGSDTCMNDDGSLVACAACSGGIGMVRFGCNPLIKKCQCHVFPQDQTACTTHEECFLPDTGCGYVDAYLQPGFGNVPCSSCSSQAICVFTARKTTGQCVCLLRPTPFQACAVRGQRVVTDATKLCLLSASSSMSNAQYVANYRTLAAAPCAIMNQAQSFCLQVYLSADTSTLLVVGLSIVSTGSGGASRRLLSVPAVGANWTSQPCKSIMSTSDRRPYEQYLAGECERWYQIGELTMVKFNMSNEDPCAFTTVLGTINIVLKQDKMVPVVLYLARHTEYFAPIARFILTFNISKRPGLLKLVKILNKPFNYSFLKYPVMNATVSLYSGNASLGNDTVKWNGTMNNSTRRRRLLWREDLQAITEWSISILEGKSESAPNANEWVTGPFVWPPAYNYWEAEYPCLAMQLLFNYTMWTISSTYMFYSGKSPPRPVYNATFLGSLPHIKARNVPRKAVPWFMDLLQQTINIDLMDIRHYISSADGEPSQLSQDLKTIFSCNFDHVQHCSAKNRSLGWSAILLAVAFIVLNYILVVLQVQFSSVFLIMAFTPALMLFVYQYSIFCVPLLPTCFGDDLVEIVEWALPKQLRWPSVMQRWPGCLEGDDPLLSDGKVNWAMRGSVTPGTHECLRNCDEWPFDFRLWQDNAAWLVCDLGYCSTSYQWVHYWHVLFDAVSSYTTVLEFLSPWPFEEAVAKKATFLADEDMRSAQRVCFTFTVVQFVPLFLLAVSVLFLIVGAAFAVNYSVQFVLHLLLSLFLFVHTR